MSPIKAWREKSLSRKRRLKSEFNLKGVATIFQGTIVQGDSCPRDFCPMTQLSKPTFVQGDFCTRSKFDKVKAAHIIFFHCITHLYGKSQ